MCRSMRVLTTLSQRALPEVVDAMMTSRWAYPIWYHGPCLSRLDNLAFRHGKETKCTLDHRDSKDAKIMAGHMLSLTTEVRVLVAMQCALDGWMWCIQWRPLQPATDHALPGHGLWDQRGPLAQGLSKLRELTCLLIAASSAMPQDDDDDDDNEMGCILKKGTHFTALYTQKLCFFDIRNYLLPSGFSYAKYLSIYSGPACQGWKSLSPMHTWKTCPGCVAPCCLMMLSNHRCVTQWKRAGPSCGSAELCWPLPALGMWGHDLASDLLVHYNNCDVVPFLMALQKQCNIYKEVVERTT